MRWPWWRKPPNGDAAKQANQAASEEFDQARSQSSQVEATARKAREAVRRSDLFAREIERAMRPRGTS